MKKTLSWIGGALAVLSIFFVSLRLRQLGAEVDFTRFGPSGWNLVAALALAYGFTNILLGFAWGRILKTLGVNVSAWWVQKTYGLSQLAKYTPGNIFHFAGRQAMGMAADIPSWPLAKSSFWELGLLSSASALFGFLVLPLFFEAIPLWVGVVSLLISVIIFAFLLGYFVGSQVVRALFFYVGFLAISGILFTVIIKFLVLADQVKDCLPWVVICGAYIIAWLVGLVTPGAPAGVGVRELVLLFLLKGLVSEADLLLAVVLGRMVTVFGDIFYFLMASVVKVPQVE